MATFTQLWTLFCVLLVAPTVVAIHSYCDSRDHCRQKGRLYPIYKKLEDALMNNSEALYMMKLSFFPVHSLRWLAVGVDIIPISVCVTIRNTSSCQFDMVNESPTLSNASENRHFHQCWTFRWTNSPLLNLNPMDQLLAFEPFLVTTIYSGIAGDIHRRALDITLHIESLPCMPLSNDTEEALTLLLSWVSWYPNTKRKYMH